MTPTSPRAAVVEDMPAQPRRIARARAAGKTLRVIDVRPARETDDQAVLVVELVSS